MKILFPIISFYPNQKAGPSLSISWLVKALSQVGVKTTVVTTTSGITAPIAKNKWISNEYGRIIYHSYLSQLLPLRAIWTSIKQVKHHDIVHLNYMYNPLDLIVGMYALLLKKQVIWAASGVLDEKALKYKSLKKSLYLAFFKPIFRNKITFHSTSMQESNDIKRVFGENVRIVEHPNYIEAVTRKNLPIKNYFLFVGRINPIKGLENLIKAIHLSKKIQDSNYLFYIAGDAENSYGMKLKEMVLELGLSKRIIFVGQVEDEEKNDLFGSAYFSILPSHCENFGNVVTESLVQQTPVIASTGTPWQILADLKSGFWCSNSPESLAEVIEKAIELPVDEYFEYRENAERTSELFIITYNIHKWHESYKNLLPPTDTSSVGGEPVFKQPELEKKGRPHKNQEVLKAI